MISVKQARWDRRIGWNPAIADLSGFPAQLVFIFGGAACITSEKLLAEVSSVFGKACIIGCTTAGEIMDVGVGDETLVCTALAFERTACRGLCLEFESGADSFSLGSQLGTSLVAEDLRHIFVLSDGIHINGTRLVHGIRSALPERVTVTGGLAGDGERFQETFVAWNGKVRTKSVAAVGLYGDGLRIGYGSIGGWDPFGPERLVTKSDGNILYALDGISALDIYRQYLGEFADGLPATGLLFPLSIKLPGTGMEVVRTILQIDRRSHSVIFAGDVPEGAHARLMKANFDRLIDGACDSARHCAAALPSGQTEFGLLISCVGRRMVLKQRIEEELEGVREVLGSGPVLAGFYSYGEISPMHLPSRCELHNQTMTITTLAEVPRG